MSSSSSSVQAVSITANGFVPATVTVKKGTTVQWTNNGSAAFTVTGTTAGGPSSPVLFANGTYSYTFNTVGTFPYISLLQGNMGGTVVVTQ
jgi:plastocyanin